jgi:Putative transposase
MASKLLCVREYLRPGASFGRAPSLPGQQVNRPLKKEPRQLHVLPKSFHRIRHYGLFANANRTESIATARALLNVAQPAAEAQKQPDVAPDTPRVLPCPCPCCGARMIVIEVFARGCEPRWRPAPSRIDTS